MKVFISHKQEDSEVAKDIANALWRNNTLYYLDTMDPQITRDGKELTEHIKSHLNDCTDILVVMSEQTRFSQWVPFEVGMAAQLELPTVTYLQAYVDLPEFLSYWPRLRGIADISTYVSTRKGARTQPRPINEGWRPTFEYRADSRPQIDIPEFYSQLKSRLR